jgi:hypothetical protein
MSRVLREDNDNKYIRKILEAETYLTEQQISIVVLSGDCVEIRVMDRSLLLRSPGASFPRFTDDERLYLE